MSIAERGQAGFFANLLLHLTRFWRRQVDLFEVLGLDQVRRLADIRDTSGADLPSNATRRRLCFRQGCSRSGYLIRCAAGPVSCSTRGIGASHTTTARLLKPIQNIFINRDMA